MFGARHEKKAVAVGDSGGGDVTSRNIGDSLGAPLDKQDMSVADSHGGEVCRCLLVLMYSITTCSNINQTENTILILRI